MKDKCVGYTLYRKIIINDLIRCICVYILGGVSLSKSGIVPTGQASPKRHASSTTENVVNPSEVNLHLLPSNPQANDQYMVHTTSRPEKAGT